jgi:2-acylglycerol O-acyltransferase 2
MGAVYRLGEYLQQFRSLGASVVRYIPPISWLAQVGAGMVPVSRTAIQRHWRKHPQHALGIVPGGIAEMFYSDTPLRSSNGTPLEETLVLNSRLGFVKLALEHGADIIPVYVFGASQTFRLWPKWVWLRELSRSLQVFLGVPIGEMGLPAPLKVPLLYAIGEAIQAHRFRTGAGGAVSDADVQAAHAAFVQGMQGLFERYKAVYGWPDCQLRII